MQILTVQHIGDKQPAHIITECSYTDTCPGCGAGYKVGMSQCEYCKRPVSHEAPEHQHPAHPEHQQGTNA